MSDVYETLYYEGEIERLKIELAEAKAKIAAVWTIHAPQDGGGGATCVWCDFNYPCSTIRALADPAPQEGEPATPKPTDNSESATVEDIAAFVERFAEAQYPQDIFLPIPEESRARDGVAADVLRRMYPLLASAIRSEFGDNGESDRFDVNRGAELALDVLGEKK